MSLLGLRELLRGMQVKIGDLVCLSEYGVSRGYNTFITINNPDQLGVIIKVKYQRYPYQVHWSNPVNRRVWAGNTHHRRELKYVCISGR